MSNFIAISTEVIEREHGAARLVYLGTSVPGRSLSNADGITTRAALHFLYSLSALSRRKEYARAKFVWYAAHFDVELILKDLPARLKDVAFPSKEDERERARLRRLIERNRVLINEYVQKHAQLDKANGAKVMQSLPLPFASVNLARKWIDRQIIEVERERRQLLKRVNAAETFTYSGFKIRVRPGKSITLSKPNTTGRGWKGVTLYDLCHFFDRKPLPEVSRQFLGYSLPELERVRETALPLWANADKQAALDSAAKFVGAVTQTIEHLAKRLNEYFEAIGLKLTRWYGASSAVNTLLRQWEARREMRQFTEDNTPRALFHAIETSFYGGRIETLKLGTVPHVYVYDLNSAFAWAASVLPRVNRQWRYTRTYNPHEPFALWWVEYALPDNTYFGLLPHRERGQICYKQRGRGWYYSPEVAELARRFPGCFKVRHGYTIPYTRVSFGENIARLYEQRRELIKREGKGGGEKIIKSMLHNFYGKFAQTAGRAQYYCAPWAGFITSLVRAEMLRVTEGQERDVICFHTDAVHSLKPLARATVGEGLGEWSVKEYGPTAYIQSGIYCPMDSPDKAATRGFGYIDFENALDELNTGGQFTAEREYFVGWRLSRMADMDTREQYLRRRRERQVIQPQISPARTFAPLEIERGGHTFRRLQKLDWRNEWIDSQMVTHDTRRESGRRMNVDTSRRVYQMLDVVSARRH